MKYPAMRVPVAVLAMVVVPAMAFGQQLERLRIDIRLLQCAPLPIIERTLRADERIPTCGDVVYDNPNRLFERLVLVDDCTCPKDTVLVQLTEPASLGLPPEEATPG